MADKETIVSVRVKGTHYPSGQGAPFPPGSIVPMKQSHAEQLVEAGVAEHAQSEDDH